MIDRLTDQSYLQYQYGDSEKLKIRIEAHERYSERPNDWHALFVEALAVAPGTRVIDVGCGFGGYHPSLCAAGAVVTGVDASAGMVAEARAQAERLGLNATILEGDAQQLPFGDDQFDAALCGHMLYHVPDIERALREIRRVVRPGGRALISTNSVEHSRRLNDLHRQAARELGYTPAGLNEEGRFSLDDLPLVRAVFPNVALHTLPNAFVFPATDVALRYYASGRVDAIQRRADDLSHRAALLGRMHELIDEIVKREGQFRVPKDAGYFLATVD